MQCSLPKLTADPSHLITKISITQFPSVTSAFVLSLVKCQTTFKRMYFVNCSTRLEPHAFLPACRSFIFQAAPNLLMVVANIQRTGDEI